MYQRWYIGSSLMAKDDEPKPIPAHFWSTKAGNEPVREWIKELPKQDRQTIGDDLRQASVRLAYRDASVQATRKGSLGVEVNVSKSPHRKSASDPP